MVAVIFMVRHICYFPGNITHIIFIVTLLTLCLLAIFMKIFNGVLLNDIQEVTSFKGLFQFLRGCV
jgi:hypothetical protein